MRRCRGPESPADRGSLQRKTRGMIMPMTRRGFLLSGCAVALSGCAVAEGDEPGKGPWQMPKKEPFRTIENSWIVLEDGTRLGVRLWIPLSAEHTPVPVVWEYIPYRKRDLE